MNLKFERITEHNKQDVLNLQLLPEQTGFIESVSECLDEADHLSDWRPYAIYADENLVGFTMYGNIKEKRWGERVWLDRLLIDQKYQGKGYGKQSVLTLSRKLFDEYPVEQIYLSVYDDNKAAIHLYQECGFKFNDEIDTKGEKIMILKRSEI